jgi:hypothetical protein
MGVPELVLGRHHAVVKAAKRARTSGRADDFHRLRIRGKRLRYSLEFSSELYGGRTARYTRQLAGLQDQLGLMQDAEVAATRLADLATGEAHMPAATVFVMGGVAEQHRRQIKRLLRKLPKELSRVGGREWRDLATVMERRRLEAVAAQPPVRRVLRSVSDPEPEPAAAPPAPLAALAQPGGEPVPIRPAETTPGPP